MNGSISLQTGSVDAVRAPPVVKRVVLCASQRNACQVVEALAISATTTLLSPIRLLTLSRTRRDNLRNGATRWSSRRRRRNGRLGATMAEKWYGSADVDADATGMKSRTTIRAGKPILCAGIFAEAKLATGGDHDGRTLKSLVRFWFKPAACLF